MTNIAHGTYAGWNAHKRQGIPICVACREAARQYQTQYRQDPTAYAAHRMQVKARDLALRELWKRHEDEGRALYESYKNQLKQDTT